MVDRWCCARTGCARHRSARDSRRASGNDWRRADHCGGSSATEATPAVNTDGDTAKVLIRHLAGTQLLLSFEQIHNLIFGSQIFLLKKLNEVAGQGRPVAFVKGHIDHVKSIYPSAFGEWSYDQYLEFLYSRLLIVRHEYQIHITNNGVEYLTWVARNGRSENNSL